MSISEQTANYLVTVAENQQKVYNAGYEQGKAEGGDSYYDTFWDNFQENGEKTDYENAFRFSGFTEKNFRPKYDIQPTKAINMFYNNKSTNYDLATHLKECGVALDMSKTTSCTSAFASTNFTVLPTCDFSNEECKSLNGVFSYCYYLVTIEKLIFNPNTVINTNMFSSCDSLQNLIIEGLIGTSFRLAHSPLTAESAKSIITHLVNYSGTEKEFACSVIFQSDVWTRLDGLGNDSPNGNTWREYVNDLGWNAS